MNQRETMEPTALEADRIGFFGKAPTHGDFVSSGFGSELREVLDEWIQSGLQSSERIYGKQWRQLFHASTPWRFVIQYGLWGRATVAGVLLPSKDRVGRSFPLVIAAQIASYSGDPRWLCYDKTWFIATEALAETSRTSDFDLAGLSSGLKRLRLPRARQATGNERGTVSPEPGISIWWTVDAETGRAHGFRTVGQPKGSDFPKLLERAAVRPEPAKPVKEQPKPESPLIRGKASSTTHAVRFTIERSYATHSGTRLSVNSDALLVSEAPRLFVIADGEGENISSANAAKVTINTLADIAAQETLAAQIQETKGKLGRAQGILQSASTLDRPGERPKVSVVALTVLNDAFAVIWAGDARCYLVRDGMMRCLTRDHVEIGIRRQLSRCIGGEGQLVPEIVSDTLQDGDRFLLCTASLARTLDERMIAETLLDKPVEAAVSTLIQEALIANIPDNVSVIVAGVRREE